MATIDYKTGGYTISANKQETFTFWWGSGSNAPNEYFDVFVSPELPANQPGMQALVEVQRDVYFDPTKDPGQTVLLLTLSNPNAFAVTFIANHVRIYSGDGGGGDVGGGGGGGRNRPPHPPN